MKRVFVFAVPATVVLALAGGAVSSSRSVWRRLHRPLHIPRITAGSPCPVSRPDPKGDLSRIGFGGTAWGRGPVYPGGLGDSRPVLGFYYPPPRGSAFFGSKWSGNKVLWMVAPRRRGPVLIRGGQLDGPNRVRFELGVIPPSEFRIRRWGSSVSGAGHRASFTRVRAPGCYAWQVDGLRFSRVIVFEAKVIPGA